MASLAFLVAISRKHQMHGAVHPFAAGRRLVNPSETPESSPEDLVPGAVWG